MAEQNQNNRRQFWRNRNKGKPNSENDSKDQAPSSKGQSVEGHCKSIHEPGIYVKAFINGLQANLLIDTGATVSLVSNVVYGNISASSKTSVSPVDANILSANGTPLQVIGKTKLDIKLDNRVWCQEAIIADVNVDGILGMDFLRANDCIINIQRGIITILNEEHRIYFEGLRGCYRVTVAETVSLPPASEVIVPGLLCKSEDGCLPAKSGIIEPSEKFSTSSFGCLARTLVRSSESIPLKVMNLSSETKILYPVKEVGKFTPITEVHSLPDLSAVSEASDSNDVPQHLQDILLRCTTSLDDSDNEKAKSLLIRYSDLFAKSDEGVGRTSLVKHKINTGDKAPIKQKPRRLPMQMHKEVETHVSDMLRRGVIEPSTSPWASPIVLAKKKDGTTRFCIDYRHLNSVTIKDAYPLPRIDESLDQLSGAKWLSTLDMNTGYWQVELDDSDKHKSAFVTRQGLYEFNVMPFGLCNAPATFERLLETVLSGLQWNVCLIYLDDIIVYGSTFDKMIENLVKVFDKLQEAGLKLKARKCALFSKQVKYLGHVVSDKGVETDPDKVSAIKDWPQPIDKSHLRSFLGLCSYYRKFIKDFADIARPRHRLTEQSRTFTCTDDCNKAFILLKEKLTNSPILTHPDFSKPFIVDTDASDRAIGCVISQKQDGYEKVIAYASRPLSKSERKYCVTRKELLAVVHFIKYFRHYLYGRKCLLRTDHGSLKWLLRFKDPEGQLARWLEVVSSYDNEIQHRPGKQHGSADSLSRKPCAQCGIYQGWDKTLAS
ncbi:hypothetical protein FSP39_006179 [Pinctada imbricata]|uniref:RNA-directed DNA polymerase n=1 Tax=Pinctada imbricata TaxID=66713 RepID=A0AA89BIW6_PINIB|nr:hypothetical protein FSP39_006179 [Pinctada imbricata]